MRTLKLSIIIIGLCLINALLAACGQTGPLYLPGQKAPIYVPHPKKSLVAVKQPQQLQQTPPPIQTP